MTLYNVVIPIGGHLDIQVEAESEREAIDKAMDEADLNFLTSWDILDPVSQGNVLNFPSPWNIEVTED